MPTTLSCSYSVTAFGSLSIASLSARLYATEYDPTLPNLYGLLLTGDTIVISGQTATRTFTFLFAFGEGSASASAVVEPGELGGRLQSMRVDESGDDYAAPPLVTFDPPGSQRNAIAYAQMQVTSLNIIRGGSGYTSSPTLILKGATVPGGVQAVGRLHVVSGSVVSTIVDLPGGPYVSMPYPELVGGGGSGAYVQPVLGLIPGAAGLRVVDYGLGWDSTPTVNLSFRYPTQICTGGDFVSPMRAFMKGRLENALQTVVLAAEPVAS
jgi:hypothetical protein